MSSINELHRELLRFRNVLYNCWTHMNILLYTILTGGLLLIADAVAFIILDKTRHFSMRRDVIKRKWQNEKVFGPGHDSEVSVYRTLKEITCKNLLRDGLHLTLFVVLYLLG